MANPTILHLGPADASLAQITAGSGLKYVNVDGRDQALDRLQQDNIALLFAGPEVDLAELMTQLQQNKINVPTVALGPAQPVQNAVKAIRLGAIEYLTIPVEGEMAASLLEKFKPTSTDADPIHGDAKTVAIINEAKQFANSDATVLVRGESGVGKEVFANLIHQHSQRKNENFVAVNCAAIPENLLESELFGHVKGAFSGAVGDRKGRFQQADGGTLLLDEISEMDLSLQAKLLRAIQERVVDPVGSDKSVPVNVRLVATTNRQLEDYVNEGKFREDLYFRLNVVSLELPALRERVGDIEPLAQFFAEKFARQNGVPVPTLSPDSVTKLNECYWKGNVRELENTLHRAVLLAGGGDTIEPDHIVISPMSLKAMEQRGDDAEELVGHANVNAAAAQRYAAAAGGFSGGTGGNAPVGQSLAEVERDVIMNTLNYCQGNRTHAANILGISIRTLRNKLTEYEAE